jgi:hypothetical protein
MRVFVFDGKDAVSAGFNYSLDNIGLSSRGSEATDRSAVE